MNNPTIDALQAELQEAQAAKQQIAEQKRLEALADPKHALRLQHEIANAEHAQIVLDELPILRAQYDDTTQAAQDAIDSFEDELTDLILLEKTIRDKIEGVGRALSIAGAALREVQRAEQIIGLSQTQNRAIEAPRPDDFIDTDKLTRAGIERRDYVQRWVTGRSGGIVHERLRVNSYVARDLLAAHVTVKTSKQQMLPSL